MSTRFPLIDISQLPKLDLDVIPDESAILAARMAKFKELWALYDPPFAAQYDVDELEFDPVKINQECSTFFEIAARSSLNAFGRATSLAFSWGTNLDVVASRYPGGMPRVASEVYTDTDTAADKAAKDNRYRRRVLLSPNTFSGTGPIEAYVFWALTLAPELTDATATVVRTVYDDTVVVTCLAGQPTVNSWAAGTDAATTLVNTGGDPRPSDATLQKVRAGLSADDVAVATDVLSVVGPQMSYTTYDVDFWLFPSVDVVTARAAMLTRLAAFADSLQSLGADQIVQAIEGAAGDGIGVYKTRANSPAADIIVSERGFALVQSIRVNFKGRAE